MRFKKRLAWLFVIAAAVTVPVFAASCKAVDENPRARVSDGIPCATYAGEICAEHRWGEWERASPTCTGDGYAKRTCEACGEREEYILRAAGHTYTSEWHEAENAFAGEKYVYRCCDICGYVDLYVAEDFPYGASDADDTQSPSEEEGKSFPLAAKIIAAVGVAAEVAIITAFVVWRYACRKLAAEYDTEEGEKSSDGDGEVSGDADASDEL